MSRNPSLLNIQISRVMGSIKHYQILNKIGEGSFGTVYRCKSLKNNKEYVLKQINLNKLQYKSKAYAKAEAKILKDVSSRYIVAFYDSFTQNNILSLIIQYCAGGDLSNYIQSQQSPLKQNTIWKMFIEMTIAIADLHMNKILHRDIKSQNVFLTKEGEVRLGDLGVAKQMKNDLAHTIVGTPYYLSPQMCQQKPYNQKTDIWALGCILYEMCTGKHPFDANNQAALALKIIMGKYKPISNIYSEYLRDLVQECLITDYKRRPTARQILSKQIIMQKIDELNIETQPRVIQKIVEKKVSVKSQKPGNKIEVVPKIKKPQSMQVPINNTKNTKQIPANSKSKEKKQENRSSKQKPKTISQQKVEINKNPILKPQKTEQKQKNKVILKEEAVLSKMDQNNNSQGFEPNNRELLEEKVNNWQSKGFPSSQFDEDMNLPEPIKYRIEDDEIPEQLQQNEPFDDGSVSSSQKQEQQSQDALQPQQQNESLSRMLENDRKREQQLMNSIKVKEAQILKNLSLEQYEQIKSIAYRGDDDQIRKVSTSKKLTSNSVLMYSLYKVLQWQVQLKDCKSRIKRMQSKER